MLQGHYRSNIGILLRYNRRTIGILLGCYRIPSGYYKSTSWVPLGHFWGFTGVLSKGTTMVLLGVLQGCTEVLLWYHRGILRVLLDLGYYMCIGWVLLCY